ncbi:hypothetical protein BH20ACI1_BH20ACI1_00640 [soil metagenome]
MKLSLIKTTVLLLILCGFLAVSNIFAGTLTVTKILDTSDGVCDADCSLREAVSAANSGDVIVFSPFFNSPQTIVLSGGQILINKNLTIAGAGADLLSVSGNNTNRIFYISENAVVALSGMKLTDGLAGRISPGPIISDPNGGAISIVNSTLTLTNMILSGNGVGITGSPPPTFYGNGGAIRSYNSTLSIINSTINNNSANNDVLSNFGTPILAVNGGSVYCIGGIVNILNSTINNNTGGVVGSYERISQPILINVVNSIFNANSGSAIESNGRISVINTVISNNSGAGISTGNSQTILTVDRSIISNNAAFSSGGGIHNVGTATISNTAINNNRAVNSVGIGGGISNGGTIYIISSAITNNQAISGGGGIVNFIGQLFLTNSTVSGNVADSGGGTSNNSPGGGIYNLSNSANPGGKLILTNSTIANNRATGLGGGIRQDSLGAATFGNTIVAGNLSASGEADVSGAVMSQGFNLIGNTIGSSGWIATDLLNRNPLLAPLGNNGGLTLTHALMPGSPAINAGSNALAVDPINNLPLQGDQRGFTRFVGTVDIGAYELSISDSPVELSGRVTTSGGRGIANARIILTDDNGTVLYARTTSFGYYRFVNLPPGMTYTITVIAKRYQFNSPQIITVTRNRTDFNFIASL